MLLTVNWICWINSRGGCVGSWLYRSKFKLTYCDLGSADFSTLPENDNTKIEYSFFLQSTEAKLFLAVTIKNNFNMHLPCFIRALLLLLHVLVVNCVNISFSDKDWSQFFFDFISVKCCFSFHAFIY